MNTVLADMDLPYSGDVAHDIMNNVLTDYDYTEWDSVSLEDQADLLKDIIGEIATYKVNKAITPLENKSERLCAIEDCIRDTLKAWAIKEGYPQ